MKKHFSRVVLTMLLSVATAGESVFAQSVLLDDFEATSIRIVNPTESDPSIKYLWNQYPDDFYDGPDPGLASITTSERHDGTRSLQVNVTGGNIYLQFYPATATWNFMHEFVQPASAWTPNTYNAVRFWVKVPKQIRKASGGMENVQLGTYVNNGRDMGTAGSHYYHFYNFKYTGEWEQVIFDSHPSYLLGAGGGTEVGDVAYPFGGTANYMDSLTRFYFDGQNGLSGVPATFYFDGFELFTRPTNENINQVYGMHAVYVSGTNEIAVGWSRRKDQDTLTYEVRYAFQDIHATGWASATPAPNGTLPGNGLGAYNLMEYSTTSINVSGKNTVYIAIKPQGATLFRQIAIPISSSASAAIQPPTNLRVF